MAIHITQIEKHKFVCGLFWQSLSRPRELNREAADLAKKIDSDLMVIRMDHSTAQAGFAQSREGARKGLFSLAALVSKTLALEGAFYDGEQQPVHNWLGAFKLPDGRWAYFAVRDANFLPNGDFSGTKAEVLERLQSDYGLGGWNVVIGDEEIAVYGFHNFQARQIGSLIPRKKDGSIRVHKWWRLRQIEPKAALLPWFLGIGAALLIGTAGLLYWQHYRRVQEALLQDAEIEAARARMLRARSAASHPWAVQPGPLAVTRACMDNFVYLTPGGWHLDEYSCGYEHVTYAWSRNLSTVAYLREQVPAAVFDVDGNKASYVRKLAPAKGKDDPLSDQQAVLEPLLSRLQLMGVTIKIVRAKMPVPPPQSPQQPQGVPVVDWQTFSFTVVGNGAEPMELAALLERPGVRIEKLTYRAAAWLIEGTIYAK